MNKNLKPKKPPFQRMDLTKVMEIGVRNGRKEVIEEFIKILGLDERYALKDHGHYHNPYENQ